MRRRDLLKGVALVVPVAAGMPMASAAAQPATIQPTDILAALLNWKYAQAELYRQGNGAALLSGVERDYLDEIAQLKQAQVAALTQALTTAGVAVPAAPAFDFAPAFASRETYLDTGHTVEDAVLRSYLDVPPDPLQSNQQVLWNTSGMGLTDARTVAVLGSMANKPVAGGIFFAGNLTGMTAEQVLAVLQPYVASPWAVAGSAAVTE